jgi:DNA-directed RNA polymerase specialized sigma24 family protein
MAPAADRGSIGLATEHLEQLLARLGPGREAAGREYQAIRRKLTDFFDRRGVSERDLLADETLDRVARRVGQGAEIQNLRAYCYGVARLVLMEWRRERTAEDKALAEVARQSVPRDTSLVEARVDCLERCLRALPAESRDLILQYYAGEGAVHLAGRRQQAESLSIPYGTLTTRAYRIRVQLEECLRRCLVKSGDR